jgi:MFS family permease
VWIQLGKRGLEPSAPAKFALALAQVGLGFLLFVWGANSVGPGVATPVVFVFLIYALHTTGELCLSPVGLSAMNRLAPTYLASLIMGAWFYMTAVGNFVAGKIGEATGGESGEMTQAATLAIYNKIGWVALFVSVIVLALRPDREALDAPRHASRPRRRPDRHRGRRRSRAGGAGRRNASRRPPRALTQPGAGREATGLARAAARRGPRRLCDDG